MDVANQSISIIDGLKEHIVSESMVLSLVVCVGSLLIAIYFWAIWPRNVGCS